MSRLLKFLLLLSLLLAACAPGSAGRENGKVRVVATFSVLGDMVSVVGGDHITLSTIVAAGQDAHAFQPIAANAAAVSEADLLFENGLGFETWLDEL